MLEAFNRQKKGSVVLENKHTREDLKIMQSWPLERKIQVTQTRIVEFYNRFNGNVTVSFSGGKDSLVLLDLARRCFPDIEAVYVDTGLDFPEVRKLATEMIDVKVLRPKMRFDEVVTKYGWCYPSKDVACNILYARKGKEWALNNFKGLNSDGTENSFKKTIYSKWAFLVDAPFLISDYCCYVMKETPLNKYAKETGKHPIVGIMANESARRRQAWLKTGCNNFDSKKPLSKPLSFWTTQDVLRYIQLTKLPMASVYGKIIENLKGKLETTKEQRTGCIFCPIGCQFEKKENRFQRLAVSHPKLHKYCMDNLGLGDFLDYLKIPKI